MLVVDTILSAIWHLSKCNNQCIILKASDFINYSNIPYDEHDAETLRILLYLALVDSYDAWLYVRKAICIPELSSGLLKRIESLDLSVVIPGGDNVEKRVLSSISGIKSSYAFRVRSYSERAELLNKLLSKYSYNGDAVRQINAVQKKYEHFNYIRRSSPAIPVVFGQNACEDYAYYCDFLHSSGTERPACVTLSSQYAIPFTAKLHTVREMLGNSSKYDKISLKTIDAIQYDFYYVCSVDEDSVVHILENKLGTEPNYLVR